MQIKNDRQKLLLKNSKSGTLKLHHYAKPNKQKKEVNRMLLSPTQQKQKLKKIQNAKTSIAQRVMAEQINNNLELVKQIENGELRPYGIEHSNHTFKKPADKNADQKQKIDFQRKIMKRSLISDYSNETSSKISSNNQSISQSSSISKGSLSKKSFKSKNILFNKTYFNEYHALCAKKEIQRLKTEANHYKNLQNHTLFKRAHLQNILQQQKQRFDAQLKIYEKQVNHLKHKLQSSKFDIGHIYSYENFDHGNILSRKPIIQADPEEECSLKVKRDLSIKSYQSS